MLKCADARELTLVLGVVVVQIPMGVLADRALRERQAVRIRDREAGRAVENCSRGVVAGDLAPIHLVVFDVALSVSPRLDRSLRPLDVPPLPVVALRPKPLPAPPSHTLVLFL